MASEQTIHLERYAPDAKTLVAAAQSLADSIFDSPLYPFEFAKQQAISELNSKTDQLAARMRRLADNLTRRADDIASRRTTPNSLGEVQSDGVEIDRLCAQRDRALHACEAGDAACVPSLPWSRCVAALVWFVGGSP